MTDARARHRTVVVGSGLSGSLLVQAMARTGVDHDVVLVDREPHPCHGRRWADFARTTTHHPPTQRFARVRVAGPSWERVERLTDHTYCVWDGTELDASTDDALRRLAGHRVTCTVQEVVASVPHADIATDAGRLHADVVLDSLGPAHEDPLPATAWLHFTGARIRTEEPCFEPDVVTLMDFRVPQRGEARFVYTLPSSSQTALVELTTFSASADPPDMTDDLTAYLDAMPGTTRWTVEGREAGTLALRPQRGARVHGRRVLIGSAAGLVKASTGYGYHLMARDAEVVASELAAGRVPHGVRRHRRHRWMDAVFLQLAVSDPASLVTALLQLVERNPLDRVVRFLQEESTVGDEVRIVASLPTWPFLRAALRCCHPNH